ncbi:MAG TPA: 4-(cytidine 5'-diphospho)-2-C-methyl-D-erythritol kinase [Flavitalea sp.]|nr:4-(cytidine 5'-diphospho)-2-C-methyl-D-erythritol kinase [Flavitalea sp.]
MVRFPNSKINLGLRIIAKRNDGFHDIESLFYPLPLADAAEIIIPTDPPAGESTLFECIQSGLPIPGDPQDNLCIRAWQRLFIDYPRMPPMKMYLVKAIPVGAGLGGGSSDAIATLQLLNDLLRLNIDDKQMAAYALELGSDCPFFLNNQPALASGRGEILEPFRPVLAGIYLVLVNPDIHISTSWAFSKIQPSVPSVQLRDIVNAPLDQWKDQLINDFEAPVFEKFPLLKEIKEQFYESGAVYAAMSGTGSAIYGIYPDGTTPDSGQFGLPHQVFLLK